MNKNFKKTIVAGTATVLGGFALAGASAPANAVDWDAVAQCESSGNWSIDTGNGYSGGLQFSPSTWAAYGGSGSAANASKAEQIRVAENVLAGQGIGAWPKCGPLGLGGTTSSVSTQSTPAQAAPAPAPAAAPALVAEKAPVVEAPVAEAPVAAPAPVVEEAPVVEYTAPAAPVQVQTAPAAGTYTVEAGDSLSAIANKLGIQGGWEALYAANSGTVADANLIFVGQTLNIPA
ncbi:MULTISPECIES: transglycosylase family protein [Kocuria]|uniref:LysM peptidoglycan-binding domain-containing protein n=1 Tax=Kocuria TaxID=57493 RepID=UPI000E761EE2|nr:transglycosylase family protein [Kocuria sp. CPCC 104605]